jgi:uncharacterized protein (TIGR00661 family)
LQNSKRILVSPLDWGLGHTSRCVPIIKELQAQYATVVVACNEHQKNYLQNEVSDAEYILLKGYEVKYAKSKLGLIIRLILQVPKLITRIINEHAWLQIIIQTRKIDGVISDNRYGLFTKKVPTIFITHQLCIQVPIGKSIVHRINQYFIKQFKQCWVPDFDGNKSISGQLSIANDYTNVEKIGILSRFNNKKLNGINYKQNTILCILSGPEPQRSLLLELVQHQISTTQFFCTIVGDELAENRQSHPQITYMAIANTQTLQHLIQTHQYIITRSGYSSMMDLYALNRHAIVVPTPGQTEQEYLGDYLMKKKWHLSNNQNEFDLQKCIDNFNNFSFNEFERMQDTELILSKAITAFLGNC